MVSLIIPAFSYGPALERTVESCKAISDDLVIISTAFWEKDREAMRALTPKVVILDWNYTALNGFGEMMNRGTSQAKNDWCLLFGVGETLEHEHLPILKTISESSPGMVYTCDHDNDPNRWKRIWNRQSGARWSGLIHEEIVGGTGCKLLFRMRDTAKEPRDDPYEQEVLHYMKCTLYHLQYRKLRKNPHLLGGTNAGWLEFVNGSEEANEKFLQDHAAIAECLLSGDLPGFLEAVRVEVEKKNIAQAVNFAPTGEPMTPGA